MEYPSKAASTSLFQVYLRLRPSSSPNLPQIQESLYPQLGPAERFLTVEPPCENNSDCLPTHITLHPPSDSRKRAVEKFAFTKVFEEQTTQLDIFQGTGVVPLVEGVLGEGRDGLVATLGVTGSGKSHTILGSRSQRGLTQLSLDLLFRSIDGKTLSPASSPLLIASLISADASEAGILSAIEFLDGIYGDVSQERGNSRATTPITVGRDYISSSSQKATAGLWNQWSILGLNTGPPPYSTNQEKEEAKAPQKDVIESKCTIDKNAQPSRLPFWSTSRIIRPKAKLRFGTLLQDTGFVPNTPRRNLPQRPTGFPQLPDISTYVVNSYSNTEYAILVSMYEVYNDRIFDLLSHPRNHKDLRRRPLLFKSTEGSPDRKIVAGLRKIVCSSYEEALMVLETGLTERRVAGTGSNSVSSRSHGFFCVEVKKRFKGGISSAWSGAQLTVVDLAGSERARNAKTAGATLAEAGKINESLMYLGQCLQMQSDCNEGNKSSIVPFRQCKLTELLFSNSFPSSSQHISTHVASHHRNPQKALMIVTADPLGDFNATSQILRYSALAREVTVPRIPSIASTIFSGSSDTQQTSRPHTRDGDRTGQMYSAADIEALATDLVKMGDEVEVFTVRLAEEEGRRREAEEGWQRADERAEEREREAREECWSEMEKRLEEERRRWMGAWGEEADRNDEHLDRKLDILTRGIQIHEDHPDTTDGRVAELEEENAALHRRLAVLERELQCRSPTKLKNPAPLRSLGGQNVCFGKDVLDLDNLDLNQATKTPGRKIRKLTPKSQVLGDENEDIFGSP